MQDFTPGRLHDFVVEVVSALGSTGDEPRLVADQLIRANLCGHDSHGIGMLPKYVDSVHAGLLTVNASPKTVVDSGPVLVLDGQSGFGQVMGFRSMSAGIEIAGQHGIALVGLRNSFHIGRIGHWGEQAARAGMVSLHFVNVAAHEPLVAPYAGADARFGTNPVCIAIPAGDGGEPAALLDMATSTIALGKTRIAKNKGEPVPQGTLLDSSGRLTTDPNVMWNDGPKGALVAMGDHKGSGLALMCEILGAALLGGMTIDPRYERTGAILNSMLSIIIDPAAVGDTSVLARDAGSFLDYVKQSTIREGFDEVLIPGEPEGRACAIRSEAVPVDDNTVAELNTAAAAVGVEPLLLREGDVKVPLQTWGATPEEIADAMAGDELISDPPMNATRSITIAAQPDQCFSMAGADGLWTSRLVQLRLDRQSRSHQRKNHLAAVSGTAVGRYGAGWSNQFHSSDSWTDPADDDTRPVRTRLSQPTDRVHPGVRNPPDPDRYSYGESSSGHGPSLPEGSMVSRLLEFGDGVMVRRQLLNIRSRAEATGG